MELSKQEIELSKQEMELFLPLPGLWSKNFFYKIFLICSKGFKIDFQNRKWNYPNRKWNYFSHLQASDQKTYFTTCFSFLPRDSKLILKTGNGIMQTGNRIISPTSRPLIKELLLSWPILTYLGAKYTYTPNCTFIVECTYSAMRSFGTKCKVNI